MQAATQLSPSVEQPEFDRCADIAPQQAQPFVGEDPASSVGMTDAEKRAAIDRMARAQERAFLTWHVTGCFAAAAAYTEARGTWERALMQWGRVA